MMLRAPLLGVQLLRAPLLGGRLELAWLRRRELLLQVRSLWCNMRVSQHEHNDRLYTH
jgi:hypothetical protein